jgi:enoyl-CoA hydratase
MEHTFVKLEQEGTVTVVIIRRPPMNALSTDLLHQLRRVVEDLAGSARAKVVVITGEGKAFVAGADIAEMKDMDARKGREYATLGQSVLFDVENLPQPTIAAVNGYALGGGCELALACDIRIASTTATFGQPEVGLGVIPGFGGTQRLTRLVGYGKAKELIFTGDVVGAAEAHRVGLVNSVVEAEKLLQESVALGQRIASKGQLAVRLAKKAIGVGAGVDLRSGCAFEAEMLAHCFATEDQKEGMRAFLEKRKPEYKER